MMFTSYTTLMVFGLATLSAAHMEMTSPQPFGKSSLDNSPLKADGSDFPCKQRPGVYDVDGASNTFALGSKQTVSFEGGAFHGGGSCQFSVTYDEAPTASSKFKVIHSVEGGCPRKGQVGNDPAETATEVDPDTYSFTVPTDLPTGTAVFAWTWFNKVGNREMYMNCAPITITAAASKRSEEEDPMARNVTQLVERDQTAFNALPDMFVANIGSGCIGTGSCAQCQVPESVDVLFPTPGTAVDQFGTATSSALGKPTGASCGVNYLGGGAAAPAATGGASVAAPATTPAVAPASTSPAPVATNTALSGGVFATIPTSAATQATSAPAVVAPSSAPASTPVASPVAPVAPSSTPVASASTPASTGTTGSGSAITAGTACTTEGMWNCIGGTSFQQCASGTWSAVQPLAAGTSCTAGQSMAIDITKHKRALRFSSEHKRHLQNS